MCDYYISKIIIHISNFLALFFKYMYISLPFTLTHFSLIKEISDHL